jgi:hypothetical protein
MDSRGHRDSEHTGRQEEAVVKVLTALEGFRSPEALGLKMKRLTAESSEPFVFSFCGAINRRSIARPECRRLCS